MPGGGPAGYPAGMSTAARRALYNNLDRDADLALAVDLAVSNSLQAGWRDNAMKVRRVWLAIRHVLATVIHGDLGLAAADTGVTPPAPKNLDAETDRILELVKRQNDY